MNRHPGNSPVSDMPLPFPPPAPEQRFSVPRAEILIAPSEVITADGGRTFVDCLGETATSAGHLCREFGGYEIIVLAEGLTENPLDQPVPMI